MKVVVSYTINRKFCTEVVDIDNDFNSVKGWNETMAKLNFEESDSSVVVLYTHVLKD
jgi:hypothetical protein